MFQSFFLSGLTIVSLLHHTTAKFHQMRMDSKRVWPILVSNSLDLGNNSANNAPNLCNTKLSIDTNSTLNIDYSQPPRTAANSCLSSAFRWLFGRLSEICCVSGMITVIVGSLTALSGLFPKNQVSLSV